MAQDIKNVVPPQEKIPRSPREMLPTMYDLPSEEAGEPGVPDEFHVFQAQLLRETFQPKNYDLSEVFIGADIYLYYDVHHQLWYKRPDWFAAVGVPCFYDNQELRYSYVLWQEEVSPLIAVEFLSESTEKEDLGKTIRDANQPPTKWQVYEQILKIPYYFTFDRVTNELKAFRLEDERYSPFLPQEDKYWISSIELGLGIWQGKYEKADRLWLRWYDSSGNAIPTRVEQEQREKEQAKLETEQARREKEAAKLETEAAQREKETAKFETEQAQREKEAAKLETEKAQREKEAAKLETEKAQREKEAAKLETEKAQREKEAAKLETEKAQREKEAALEKLQQLANKLRELGIDPDKF